MAGRPSADVLEQEKRTATSKANEPVSREDSRRGHAPPARSGAELEPPPKDRAATSTRRGRGRPAEQEDSVVVSVRFAAELVDKIDAIIAESGHFYRDRSEFIRQTVAKELRNHSGFGPPQSRRTVVGFVPNDYGGHDPVYKGDELPDGFVDVQQMRERETTHIGYVEEPNGKLRPVYEGEPEPPGLIRNPHLYRDRIRELRARLDQQEK